MSIVASSLPASSSASSSKVKHEDLQLIDKYWRAANYLTVGQIYLQGNALMKEPLKQEHVKPRLLGHFGTSPGLSLLYVHMNRCLKERQDLNTIFVTGPGHGGPAIVANVYLEGTYTEFYPKITQDAEGLRNLFRQFSTPGGIPSHVSPPTPGSIHEGGELGYVLTHATGAVMDNPNLLALAVVGDGEAETGPLAGSWKCIKFLNPKRDGAILPVLHLNGYKIASPTILGRESNEDVQAYLSGLGYDVHFVIGDDPMDVHKQLAAAFDECLDKIQKIQKEARAKGAEHKGVPRWPAIVMRTPKGWTGPKDLDGKPVENTFRSHQVPIAKIKDEPEHLKKLEQWLRSYKPEELFDENGSLKPELKALAPKGDRRMGSIKHANGGLLTEALKIPDLATLALEVKKPASVVTCSTEKLGELMRELYRDNPTNFRVFCPDELASNRLQAVLEVSKRCWQEKMIDIDDNLSPDGRVLEVLSEHLCEGWLEGYLLTGRHGMFASYEAFALIVASMVTQHGKWVEACQNIPWRAPIPSLNILLSSTCYRQDHNGFSHQGPGFMETVLSRKNTVSRIYFPVDANTLLVTGDHCFRHYNKLNLIVQDKQPQLQYLTIDEAREHLMAGMSIWKWASSQDYSKPDIVMASCGDTPTQEIIAAVDMLRRKAPNMKVRVVNVLDLFSVCSPDVHPHGVSDDKFNEIFTPNAHVILAFHGYSHSFHALLHRRDSQDRFHIRGFREQGTTTTPFDMVVLNELDRYTLVKLALKYSLNPPSNAEDISRECDNLLKKHHDYVREYFDDMPEITGWKWDNDYASGSSGSDDASAKNSGGKSNFSAQETGESKQPLS